MSVIKVTKSNFKDEVLESDKKVIVDFNAAWCGPCRMLGPVFEEISNEKDTVKFVSINIDDEEDLARKYNVFSIPCLVVIENGNEINRSVGLISKEDINKLIGD